MEIGFLPAAGHVQHVLYEVALAALPGRSLEVAHYRLLDPLVVVACDKLNAGEAPCLEVSEEVRPGGLVLGVGDLDGEDLTHPF